MRETEGQKNERVWHEKHPYALIPEKKPVTRDMERLEGLIADFELCLQGNPASKKWKAVQLEQTIMKNTLHAMRTGRGWGHTRASLIREGKDPDTGL